MRKCRKTFIKWKIILNIIVIIILIAETEEVCLIHHILSICVSHTTGRLMFQLCLMADADHLFFKPFVDNNRETVRLMPLKRNWGKKKC